MGGGIASVGPTPKKVLAEHPVFNSVDSSKVCPGNNDPKFDELVKCRHNGEFINVSGKLDSN